MAGLKNNGKTLRLPPRDLRALEPHLLDMPANTPSFAGAAAVAAVAAIVAAAVASTAAVAAAAVWRASLCLNEALVGEA